MHALTIISFVLGLAHVYSSVIPSGIVVAGPLGGAGGAVIAGPSGKVISNGAVGGVGLGLGGWGLGGWGGVGGLGGWGGVAVAPAVSRTIVTGPAWGNGLVGKGWW